jgi:phosphoribosylformimino-5-aminoimidazole carboxamide ribotide isomerase
MLIIPAIDLREGHCVRLKQGCKSKAKIYDGDPVEIARAYQRDGAEILHVVDLDGAFGDSNSLNRQMLRRIVSSIELPVQFGGGLRSIRDIQQVINSGVRRVVIGTLAVESPASLQKAVDLFGGESIAVGIDARDGQVMTRGWETKGKVSAIDLAQRVARAGVKRIIYTDVAADGMLSGVNTEQTCAIARESGLRVTASGGISSLDDILQLKMAGAGGVDSVIVGTALYEGRFPLKQALSV